MSPLKILITGSSDGLGKLTAQQLVRNGHTVYLHARNSQRASDARNAVPGAAGVLVGDLAQFSEIKSLASQINELGPLDCTIHNAGLYLGPYRETDEGYPSLFLVNVAAPYMLTCLTKPPKRLVYLTSGMARSGSADVGADFGWRASREGRWNDMGAYSTSKLWNIMFAKYFTRKFAGKGVQANALDPGWVPTKMGGASATDDIDAAVRTYVMLAEGKGESEGQSGKAWYQEKEQGGNRSAADESKQDALVEKLQDITGVKVPE